LTSPVAVAVILAAGAGRRVGGVAKALLRRADGTTLLEAVVTCARAAGVSRCLVVVGPPHDRVTAAEAARLGVAVAHNAAAHLGMASSVATGFARLLAGDPAPGPADVTSGPADSTSGPADGTSGPADSTSAQQPTIGLLWPVDHAHVQPGTVRTLIHACAPDGAAVPTHLGRGGHPAGFGRALWPALATCTEAPQGARSVLHELARIAPDHVVRIEVDDAGVIADIDTPEDRT
jgi:CTP:molybdopterin cytidylyltransferase MocA